MVRISTQRLITGLIAVFLLFNTHLAIATPKPDKLEAKQDWQPKWELGLGLSVLHLPHYPGSEQSYNLALPLPYFVYRGNVVKADRSGIRTVFLETKRWRGDLSLSGSLPVNSDDNDARAGMEDLDLTGEIGPRLSYTVWENDTDKLTLRLPLRAAISTDFKGLDYRGWLVAPSLKYQRQLTSRLSLATRLTISAADSDYHDYYYGVDTNEVDLSIGRPAYQASGGYSAVAVNTSISWQKNDWRYAAFVSYNNIAGSAYDDSPLVKTDHAVYVGAFLVWTFWKSKTLVKPDSSMELQ